MRVISGLARGHRLRAPKGTDTRPTADRVKESLFNVLGSRVPGARVLDLFAGTGSLGIEALSRGAESAIFVDSGAESNHCINKNLEATGLKHLGRLFKNQVHSALGHFSAEGLRFDLIFVDPPYGKGLAGKTLGDLVRWGLLEVDGLIAVEHGKRENLTPEVRAGGDALGLLRRLDYGDTSISLFCYRKGTEEA